jgi:multidrug resistance protein, MATE family
MTTSSSPAIADRAEYETSLSYMLKLAGPMVVSTISMTVMQFVDRFMVSRLGTSALAAVLPAGFVSFIPGGFVMGALTSLNTFVSQSLGRGEKDQCSHYFWQALYMGLAYCAIVVAVLWPTAPSLFTLLGQPAGVVEMEVIYLRIMLWANFIAVINWSSGQFFMGIHRPIIIMCSSLCGQVANVFANYVLIFGKLGLPAMGIAGAAWGTCVGMGTAAAINLAIYLGRSMNGQFGSRRTLRPDFVRMRALLRVGVPAGIGLMVNVAFWGVVLFTLVGRFGKEAMAATSAVLSYTNLSAMPIVGISTALAAAVGKAIGGGRKDLAMRQTRVCLRIGIVYMGLVGACFFLLRDSLMVFWSDDPEVIAIGSKILGLAALYQMFHASRITYAGALRGAGDTTWLAIMSGVGAIGILGIGGTLTVRFFPGFGALGPWVLAAVSIAVVGLANRWRFKSKRWMRIDLFRQRIAPTVVATETTDT